MILNKENLMNLRSIFTVTAMTTALGLTACGHSQKHAEQAPPSPAQQASSQLETDRTNYVTQTQARIDQMTQFSQQLRTNAAQTAARDAAKAKKETNAADDLDSMLNDVRKELTDVRTAAPSNWVDERRDVEKELSRMETQYSNAVTLMQ
jgi:carboxypeptidase C (cathepsin A)